MRMHQCARLSLRRHRLDGVLPGVEADLGECDTRTMAQYLLAGVQQEDCELKGSKAQRR